MAVETKVKFMNEPDPRRIEKGMSEALSNLLKKDIECTLTPKAEKDEKSA